MILFRLVYSGFYKKGRQPGGRDLSVSGPGDRYANDIFEQNIIEGKGGARISMDIKPERFPGDVVPFYFSVKRRNFKVYGVLAVRSGNHLRGP